MSLIRRHRFVALLAVVALACSACANRNAKESDVVNAMTDAKLNKTQANCIGKGIDKAFGDDQKLFNQVAAASKVSDLPAGTEPKIQQVLDDCLGAQNRTTTTQSGDTTTTSGGTTTTTAGGSK